MCDHAHVMPQPRQTLTPASKIAMFAVVPSGRNWSNTNFCSACTAVSDGPTEEELATDTHRPPASVTPQPSAHA